MPNSKFQYNPVTLTYEKVEVTWKKRLIKVSLILAAAGSFATLGVLSVAPWVRTSREKELRMENERLKAGLLQLKDQYRQDHAALENVIERDDKVHRVIFNAAPFSSEKRAMGQGGSLRSQIAASDDIGRQLNELEKYASDFRRRLFAESLSLDEVEDLARKRSAQISSYPSIQPVSNTDLKRIASGYGYRIDPHYGTRRMHTGLDFTAATGTEVYSTGDGIVVEVVSKRWGYGKVIVVDHGFGYRTRYAHLSAFKVEKGQKVKRGELIGLVGSTGKSTAPHLHYEVEYNGKKVDPAKYFHGDLTPAEYELLLEMADNANQSFD